MSGYYDRLNVYANGYVRAYKMIFAVLDCRQQSAYTTLNKMVTFFINNI